MTISSLELSAPPASYRISRWVRRLLRVSAAGALVAAAWAPIAFALAPVLLLMSAYTERVVLRFSPESARQALFDREAVKASRRLFRRGSGIPSRTRRLLPGQAQSSPRAAMPSTAVRTLVTMTKRPILMPNRTKVMTTLAVRRSTARRIWWTGERLEVTDRRGRVSSWAVTGRGVESDFLPTVMKSRHTVLAAPPTGDAHVAGLVAVGTRRLPIEAVVLLDRCSRRVCTIPASGFAEADVAAVAEHAGVEYSHIELPFRFLHPAETLTDALFPRSVRYRRIAGAQRQWGPLAPARNVVVSVVTLLIGLR